MKMLLQILSNHVIIFPFLIKQCKMVIYFVDVQKVKLTLTTDQARAYGRNCYGNVYVPENSGEYIGAFESSGDNGGVMDSSR